MPEQLELELPDPPPPPWEGPRWPPSDRYQDSWYRGDCDLFQPPMRGWGDRWLSYIRWHPRLARDCTLVVVLDEWVSIFDIFHAIRMQPQLLGRLLDQMVQWGRLEERRCYAWRGPGSRDEDPYECPPPGRYGGFHSEYRRTNKPPLRKAKP